MEKNKNYFLTTGEFAKITNVTKDTLFHYEKIGLFHPEYTDENGYRYYSALKIELFNTILLLSSIGVPLKEIKKHIENKTPENLKKLLKREKDEIDRKIRELEDAKKFIEKKILLTNEALNEMSGEIFVEYQKEERLIVTKTIQTKNIFESISKHMNTCRENGIKKAHSVGEINLYENIIKKDYYNYEYFFTKVEEYNEALNLYIKEEGKYLVLYYKEGFDTIENAYNSIISYILEKNIKTNNIFYEDALLDEFAVSGYENFMIKISIKIEEK